MRLQAMFSLLMFFSLSAFAQPVDLELALKNKLVTAKAISNDEPINGFAQSAHSGDCIELTIKNISSVYREVSLQPGQFFYPEDSTMQRMICTSKKLLKLQAGQQVNIRITAFCAQASKKSPQKDIRFIIKGRASDKLLQLAQYISEKNYKSASAQQAIWIVSDNQPVNYLQYDEPEAKDLFEFLTIKLGVVPIKMESMGKTLMADWLRTITVNLEYELERTHKMKVIIVNEKNEILKVLVNDEMQKPGIYKYNTKFVTTVPAQDTADRYCIVQYFRDDKLVDESRYKMKRLE